MKNNHEFDKNQLKRISLQYMVTHTRAGAFKVGEKVFFKANPEEPMKVMNVEGKMVQVKNSLGYGMEFLPETILQYRYAGLMVYKHEFDICLN